MRSQDLRDKINTHSILSLPKNVRLNRENAAECYKLTKMLMDYMGYSEWLEKQFTAPKLENVSALVSEEERLTAFDTCTGYPKLRYDGLAFTKAVTKAIEQYDAEKGNSFLNWFNKIYKQQLIESTWTPHAIKHSLIEQPRLKARNLTVYRQCVDLLERRGIEPGRASDAVLAQIAREVNIEVPKLRKILQLRARKTTLELSVTGEPVSAEEEESIINPGDPSSESPFTNVEDAMLLGPALDLLTTYDEQEYPRLFFNNIFLSLLKEEDAPDPEGQLEIMLANEDLLWEHIFVKGYLAFTLAKPPEPDSVEHIAKCRALYSFINKTIALYKKCSEAYISQQYSKFKQLQKRLRLAMDVLQE